MNDVIICNGIVRYRRPRGYWNNENTVNELKGVINEIGHFPTCTKLIKLGHSQIMNAMQKNGGVPEFRKLLGYESTQKQVGYWTEEVILNELKTVEQKLGHFPKQVEFRRIGRNDLEGAIAKHGGLNKFRELSGHTMLKKPNGYWTEAKAIKELKVVIDRLKHFPTKAMLKSIGKRGLCIAINRHGGLNKFREKLGYKLSKKPIGYWTDKTIIKELKEIEKELNRPPVLKELKMNLQVAVQMYGGLNRFRQMLGWDLPQKPDGFWADRTIIDELQKVIEAIRHFPTQLELMRMDRNDLQGAIAKHGGLNKFRELLGYSVSLYEQYRIECSAYSSRRGKKTEYLVEAILVEWCKQNGYSKPIRNKKLGVHNVIEFTCTVGKYIGIDVTNTKDVSGQSIRKKYLKKDYHKYLDELWIVVFSNVFKEHDYRKFNEESPDNVKVMSIDTFLEELDISTDECMRAKIDGYKNCTFRTKDEFVKRHLNKNLAEYV